MRDPTLVLLSLPVELKGTDGAEGGEGGVDDEEIDVVAEIDPDQDEEGEERDHDWGGNVVERFRSLLGKKGERGGRGGLLVMLIFLFVLFCFFFGKGWR